jgi:tetratricopeptide (TPR) repeat protein
MDVGSQVDALEAKGLIRVASYRPELEYLFRHWLVQDAAYGSLLKQERRELHRQVGEALESLYPDRRTELSGILAMHFEQAGETGKAIGYYLGDAWYALDRHAIREAYAAAEHAANLLPPASEQEDETLRKSRVEVAVLRARAGFTFRPVAELVAELDEVIPFAEGLGEPELLIQAHLYRALLLVEHGRLAGDEAVARSLDRLNELSETLDDPSLAALPMAMLAMNKVHTGSIREGVEALATAIPLMEKRRDFIGAAFARGWLAMGYADLGEFEKAEEAARQAKEAAADGDLIAQLDAQIAEAMVKAAKGELDETVPLARACIERSEETGATACAVVSAFVLGDVLHRRGSYGEAKQVLELGLGLSSGMTGGSWGPTLQAWLRANAVTMGDLEAAEGGFDEALDIVRREGNQLGEASILWKRADSAARRERWDEAFRDYADAAAIFEAQGARPNLARVLRAWGEALREAGRDDEAESTLRRSLALFEEMGLAREAGEVRAELAGAAA